MATIGDMKVRLSLDNSDFISGIRSAKWELFKFRAANSFEKFLYGIALAVGWEFGKFTIAFFQ